MIVVRYCTDLAGTAGTTLIQTTTATGLKKKAKNDASCQKVQKEVTRPGDVFCFVYWLCDCECYGKFVNAPIPAFASAKPKFCLLVFARFHHHFLALCSWLFMCMSLVLFWFPCLFCLFCLLRFV